MGAAGAVAVAGEICCPECGGAVAVRRPNGQVIVRYKGCVTVIDISGSTTCCHMVPSTPRPVYDRAIGPAIRTTYRRCGAVVPLG